MRPGDAGWDEARLAWNLAVDQHPAAVAIPERRGRRRRAVRFARDNGLGSASRAPATTPPPTTAARRRSLLIKTDRMRERRDRPGAQTARVERRRHLGRGRRRRRPSTGWPRWPAPRTTSASSATRSAAASAGSPASTASPPNSVTAIEIVTADGDLRARRPPTTDPDLFWALRGGGGNFGVVTAIEFGLLPDRRGLRGRAVLPVRARRARSSRRGGAGPRPCRTRSTSVGRMLQVPPLPEIPELAARPVVRRRRGRVHRLPRSEAAELLAPLRELGPEMDTFATIGRRRPAAACTWTRPGRCPGIGDHQMLADLDAESLGGARRGGRPGLRRRRCSRSSSATSAARSAGARRAAARSAR